MTRALEHEQHISGQDYLEKIIQVSFELPLPQKVDLRRLLFPKLDEVLSQAGITEEDFNEGYWTDVYFDGIDGFISTPRDIVRLTNSLRVTYPAVQGEVDPVDFIAIETLRVFCPTAYEAVRSMPHEFAGTISSSDRKSIFEESKPIHDSWIEQLPEHQQEPVKRLLKRIFPKFAQHYGGSIYGGEWASKWRKARYIRSEEIFPVYFRLSVPEGDITNVEMRAYLTTMSDPADFKQLLLDLASQIRPDGTTRVRAFLERLEDYTDKDIPEEQIPTVNEAFFDVGDQLILKEDEPRGMGWDLDNQMRIARVLYQLGQQLKSC